MQRKKKKKKASATARVAAPDAAPESPGLLDRRVSARFAVKALLLLALLLAPWPGLGPAFASVIAAVSNPVLALLVSGPTSLQLAPDVAADSWNALLTIERDNRVLAQLAWELRRTPYIPTATFTALCLAYPASRLSRRLFLLALGLGMLLLLPFLRLVVFLGEEGPLQFLQMPTAVHAVLTIAIRALVLPPGMAFAVPALLFLVLLLWLDPGALGLAIARGSNPSSKSLRRAG